MSISRHEYLLRNRAARAWAALAEAENANLELSLDPTMPEENSLNGKRVVVIGSGVGGLTTAFELLHRNSDIEVTVLEARDRTGGRCMSLRTGDTLTEDVNSNLVRTRPGEPQVIRFERPVGDAEPYLNAGPGRIPSSHKRLLDYLRRFGVPVEVYVMASGSNMSFMKQGPAGDEPVVNRQVLHNTRGWVAEMVYKNARRLLKDGVPKDQLKDRVTQLRSLMVTFGDLNHEGEYIVGTAKPGQDDSERSDRAGFDELPGVRPGKIAEAFQLEALLQSEFWKKTRMYQPVDFLWQPTLFQPVGGMDRVQHAFAQQVAAHGGTIHLNSPVRKIEHVGGSYRITADGHADPFEADYVFCNAAMPFLKQMLSKRLVDPDEKGGFSTPFKRGLQAVFKAQFGGRKADNRFLAPTTKVGWQARRRLWQGKPYTDHGGSVLKGDDDELGVVPIYGGISWTDHPITQIWYPSTAYHDRMGVLTGCYNFGQNAVDYGKMPIDDRLDRAREGARLFGGAFADGLEHGVAIAWQNMPHIKGGWAQWTALGKGAVRHYNHIVQGTGVDGQQAPSFFVVGDQTSSLPGWQEGAIATALNAISRLVAPHQHIPHLAVLPDTRLMVEGL